MDYYVYILYSEKSKIFYRGITNNLLRRFKEHNNCEGKYTCRGVPWLLVWYCTKPNKSDALIQERELKNIGSHQRVVQFIKKHPCAGGRDVPTLSEVPMKTSDC